MIYLDYNATTPLCDAAREAMSPYLVAILVIRRVCTPQAAKRAPPLTMRGISWPRSCTLNRMKSFSRAAEPSRATWLSSVSRDCDHHAAATSFQPRPNITRC